MTLACSIGSGRVVARRFAGSLRRLITSDDRREHDLALTGRLGLNRADRADKADGADGADGADSADAPCGADGTARSSTAAMARHGA
ncbi:hypothetical protein [Nitratidesulfovibrio termitidis]|uniref:hypothetical protein n=1 Tax=Nitratidesulfovibrio termitidis TaxID=42252 RepID=UPI0003F8CD8D|nr:hypothetical protein [Nitratidesulfovibrio termitidis]